MHAYKKADSMVLPTHSQTASDLNWLIKGVNSDGFLVLHYGIPSE